MDLLNAYEASAAVDKMESPPQLISDRDWISVVDRTLMPILMSAPRGESLLQLRKISEADYSCAFERLFPGFSEIFDAVGGLYAAGPTASALFADIGEPAPEVDLYCVNVDDGHPIWNKVCDIHHYLRRSYDGRWIVTVSPGVVTMRWNRRATVRVHLRMFDTLAALLDGFAICSTQVAFNGVTHMTRSAAWAIAHRLNIVDLRRKRGAAYEEGLVEQFARGYDIGFLGMRINALKTEGLLELPFLRIDIGRDRDTAGTPSLKWPSSAFSPDAVGSPSLKWLHPRHECECEADRAAHNIREARLGSGRFIHEVDAEQLEAFGTAPARPTLVDILPERVLDRLLDAAIEGIGRGDREAMVSIFQMSDIEIQRTWEAIAAFGPAAAPRLLAPYRAAVISAYDNARYRKIDWEVVPEAPWAREVHCSPAEWYGDAAAPCS